MTDRELMQAAIALAREAAADGEVPVGAVVTRNGEIVSVGRNRREKDKNALAHADVALFIASLHDFRRVSVLCAYHAAASFA